MGFRAAHISRILQFFDCRIVHPGCRWSCNLYSPDWGMFVDYVKKKIIKYAQFFIRIRDTVDYAKREAFYVFDE